MFPPFVSFHIEGKLKMFCEFYDNYGKYIKLN